MYRVPTRDRFRGVNQKSNIDFISDVLRVEIGKDKSGRIETFRRTTFLLISVISLAVSSTSRGENREFESISKGGGRGEIPSASNSISIIRSRRGGEEKPKTSFTAIIFHIERKVRVDRYHGRSEFWHGCVRCWDKSGDYWKVRTRVCLARKGL